MENENPTAVYNLKYGGIEEVIAGEGRDVDNFEELYSTVNTRDLIAIPKVVGVHQTMSIEEINLAESSIQNMAQRVINREYGSEDNVEGTLISLIYDPEIMRGDVLRTLTSKKDVLKRLMLADYKAIPDFGFKPLMSHQKMAKLLNDLQGKKTKKMALTLLEREVEYFILNKTTYGLTRLEAINCTSLSHMIGYIKDFERKEKAGDLDERKVTNLEIDPIVKNLLTKDISRLFEEFLRRHRLE